MYSFAKLKKLKSEVFGSNINNDSMRSYFLFTVILFCDCLRKIYDLNGFISKKCRSIATENSPKSRLYSESPYLIYFRRQSYTCNL